MFNESDELITCAICEYKDNCVGECKYIDEDTWEDE